MNLWPIFWTLAAALANGQFRVSVQTFEGVYVDVEIGTPAQTLELVADTRTPHLMVMDSDCWGWKSVRRKCPIYCNNGMFRSLYCSRFCQPFSTRLNWVRCAGADRFRWTDSTTLRRTDDDVVALFNGFRPLYGQRAHDRVVFEAPELTDVVKDKFSYGLESDLNVSNANFVRGLSFDKRYFRMYSGGILGLAPRPSNGQPSLVPHLKAVGQIERAVVSIQSAFEEMDSNFLFGSLDEYACEEWRLFAAHGDGGWSFRMENVRFAEELFAGMNIGRISLESQLIRIPAAVGQHFTRIGLLHSRLGPDQPYYVSSVNRSRLHLEFAVGTAEIRLEPRMLSTGVLTRLVANGEVRYGEDNEWTFGSSLLEYFCFGYDYDERAVAWARHR